MRFLWKCGSVDGIESISRPFTASNTCIQYPCDEVGKMVSELGKMRGRKNGLERSTAAEAGPKRKTRSLREEGDRLTMYSLTIRAVRFFRILLHVYGTIMLRMKIECEVIIEIDPL